MNKKADKFKEGQFVVITEDSTFKYESVKVGWIYRVEQGSIYLHICLNTYSKIREVLVNRLNTSNWKYADNREIKMYIKEGKPCKVINNNINIDEYSII